MKRRKRNRAVAVSQLGEHVTIEHLAIDPSPEPWRIVATRERLDITAYAKAARLSKAEVKRLEAMQADGPEPSVLIGLTPTWTAEIVGYVPAKPIALAGDRKPCPGCHDAKLRQHEACLVCSATDRHPTQWPMTYVDAQPSPRPPLKEHVETRRQKRAAKYSKAS